MRPTCRATSRRNEPYIARKDIASGIRIGLGCLKREALVNEITRELNVHHGHSANIAEPFVRLEKVTPDQLADVVRRHKQMC